MTPLSALRLGMVPARLEILEPQVPNPIIPLRFNPSEYQLQKTNTFAEIGIPGLESPPIQFVRGTAEKLTLELLADTSDTLDDVREKYVNKLRELMRLNEELHAPPIVAFSWDTQVFKGVLESLNISYVLFSPDGVPLRAKLSVVLKEYRPAVVQLRESTTLSPDFDKTFVVRHGDTLSGIAGQIYRDPARWRDIARANGIVDLRSVRPGDALRIPKLR